MVANIQNSRVRLGNPHEGLAALSKRLDRPAATARENQTLLEQTHNTSSSAALTKPDSSSFAGMKVPQREDPSYTFADPSSRIKNTPNWAHMARLVAEATRGEAHSESTTFDPSLGKARNTARFALELARPELAQALDGRPLSFDGQVELARIAIDYITKHDPKTGFTDGTGILGMDGRLNTEHQRKLGEVLQQQAHKLGNN